MWFTKSENGYNAWFVVVTSTGILRTGLTSGSFLVTVRNPQDTVSALPPVTESGKQGLYKFNITSSFLQTHGTGSYCAVVEINATLPSLNDVFAEVLQVYSSDFDSITFSSSSMQQVVSGTASQVWDLSSSGHTNPNTFGAMLLSASQGPTPVIDTGAIATAVWSHDISAYATTGQAATTINVISGSINTMASDITFIKQIEGGRWKIENNMMKFYKDDNSTLIAEFNLLDSSGFPTESAVAERVRV